MNRNAIRFPSRENMLPISVRELLRRRLIPTQLFKRPLFGIGHNLCPIPFPTVKHEEDGGSKAQSTASEPIFLPLAVRLYTNCSGEADDDSHREAADGFFFKGTKR